MRSWQSDKDIERRRAMIQQIEKLLKQRNKNDSKKWLGKLPRLVKQVEVSLYRSASSLEEYSDTSTLKARIHRLAMGIVNKMQQANDQNGRKRNNLSVCPSSQPHDSYPLDSYSVTSQPLEHLSARTQHEMNTRTSRSGVYFNYSYTSCSLPYPIDCQSSHRICSNDGYTPKHISQDDHRRHSQSQAGRSMSCRNKQQRILLLRHAAECQYENGSCPYNRYCASMKRLWRHITNCKDPHCKRKHCISSRYILTHYRDCKDPHCQVCMPVRLSCDIKRDT